jgi:PAS domain S-box-containing protein
MTLDIRKQHITLKIMTFLFLASLGFLVLLILFYIYIEKTEHDSTFINIAGRQRMLSQEMLSLTHMMEIGQKEDRHQLLDTVNNFDEVLQFLENGGITKEKIYLPPASGNTKIKLNTVNEHWSLLKPLLQRTTVEPSYSTEFNDAIQTIKTNIHNLTTASDEVIVVYDSRITHLRNSFFYALIFFTSTGFIFFIFAIRSVGTYAKNREDAEKQLRTSENRFSLAVAGTNDGIWDWDITTGKIFLSDRWKAMLLYQPNDIQDTFISWRDLIHPDDLKIFLLSWIEYMEGDTTQFHIEYRLRTKDNQYKWIMCRGTSSTKSGVPTRLAGSHTDISTQKEQDIQLKKDKKEQALLIDKLQIAKIDLTQSEDTLRLSQIFSKVGSWEWNIETNKLVWSELMRPMFGLSSAENEDEVTYEIFINAIHPEDRSAVLKAIDNCINNNMDYNIEHRIIWSDGTVHWLHERGNVLHDKDNNPVRMLGLVHDITKKKEAEEALNKSAMQSIQDHIKLSLEHKRRVASEEKLSNILDIAPEAIIVINGNQEISVFNKGAEKIFGYKADEIMGKSLDLLIPDNLADIHKINVVSFISSSDIARKMGARKSINGKRKNGDEFPCGASISKIQKNEEWFCTVILRDLSDQIKAQTELIKEKNEQGQLIIKLQDAQDQLLQSEKMASIGQLAAGVAHEINNPVGYINSNIGSLKKYLDDVFKLLDTYESSEINITDNTAIEKIKAIKQEIEIDYLKNDIKDLITESEEGVSRVKKIVQDLKEFSHVGEAEWQWANLHTGLDSTLNIVHNELKYKADVIKEYGNLPDIECIVSQLNQVFMNILVNAAHAIEQRGTITVRSGTEDNGVWIEIEDSGKGMNEETKRRIYDPFYTTKPVGKGTGLGMSLSFKIIEKHNGKIEVKSELGKGTCFHLWLPINHEEEQTKGS